MTAQFKEIEQEMQAESEQSSFIFTSAEPGKTLQPPSSPLSLPVVTGREASGLTGAA